MSRLSTRILKKFTSCTRRQKFSETDSEDEPEERYPEQHDSGRYTRSTGVKTELEVQNKKNVNLRKEKHDLTQQIARLTHINKQLQNENSVYRRTIRESGFVPNTQNNQIISTVTVNPAGENDNFEPSTTHLPNTRSNSEENLNVSFANESTSFHLDQNYTSVFVEDVVDVLVSPDFNRQVSSQTNISNKSGLKPTNSSGLKRVQPSMKSKSVDCSTAEAQDIITNIGIPNSRFTGRRKSAFAAANKDPFAETNKRGNSGSKITKNFTAKSPVRVLSSEDTARSAKLFKPERVTLKRTSKDEITCQILLKAFRNNKILKTLDIIQLNDMIACMVPINFAKNESFIKYKEKGDYLYVIVNGDICVEDPNKPAFNLVANTGNPIAMGEIALWSNAERTASCTIVSENGGYGFKLTAAEFDTVMSELVEQRKDNKEEFLKKVLMDKHGITMNQVKLNSLIMSAKIVEYSRGDKVIQEGEKGNVFYIFESGQVEITQVDTDTKEDKHVRYLGKGCLVGMMALVNRSELRTASVTVVSADCTAYEIKKEVLHTHLDMRKEAEDIEHLRITDARLRGLQTQKNRRKKYDDFNTIDLSEMQQLSELGCGQFGTVTLYKVPQLNMHIAVKAQVNPDNRQDKEYLDNEIRLHTYTDSQFIVKMYRNYMDEKFTYMYLELCPFGNLHSLMRTNKKAKTHFDEFTVKFYMGCVIEALDYLHNMCDPPVAFRDLKLENLVLSQHRYVKLTDFGISKELPEDRPVTATFCGTYAYMAPEMLKRTGHNQLVDLWAAGVLLFELIVGHPPFGDQPDISADRNIKNILAERRFPRLNEKSKSLVKTLLKMNPAERLGAGADGFDEIRSHTFFKKFDWTSLALQTLPAPKLPESVISGMLKLGRGKYGSESDSGTRKSSQRGGGFGGSVRSGRSVGFN